MHSILHKVALGDIGQVTFDAPLCNHSWWHIGGPADMLVEPCNIKQVQTLRRTLQEFNIPNVIIGDGSNLLFDDAGVRGVVIKIGRALSRFTVLDEFVVSEAGIFVPKLVQCISKFGLGGLEHTIGIPGTLGGLILMNGGSLQKGIGSHVMIVKAVNREGELIELSHDACGFAYRHSALQEADLVIVEARLRCDIRDSRTIRRDMLAIMRSRRAKFPLKSPNCGSVFISDPTMYATVGPPGKVIEDCGFKGLRIGDAMIPQIHANFIVNLGSAKSSDVLKIIKKIRSEVKARTGYLLMCEARYVTPACLVVAAHHAIEGENG